MKRMVVILIILMAAGFAIPARAQNADRIAERIIPSEDADLAYEDLYENLAQLTSNPLDLNRATTDELLSLGLLSQQQADQLVRYREENGALLEIYELQSIPLFDLESIHDILPYVHVGPSSPAKNFVQRIKSRQSSYFFTRYERTVEESRGYSSEADSTTKYLGDRARVYSRLRISSPGDVSLGFTAEKDAGEQIAWVDQRGFDFYSAHLQVVNKGPIVNVIAGDYVAQFGQGLALGGGFGIGKGSETITTLRRISAGFSPYTSANEAGFFRGIAATARLPGFARAATLERVGTSVGSASRGRGSMLFHAFTSSLSRDASGDDETSLAVLQSGKHRTRNELVGRHRLIEQNYGAAFEYKSRSLEGGVVVHRTTYRRPVNKSPAVYNAFDFRGSVNTNVSVFGTYNIGNVGVFGEFAQTLGHGTGWVAGIIGSISRSIDVSLLMRAYDRNYYTFYSNALSENTSPRNERGIYWGWKHAVTRKLFYTAYTDLFSFPWLRFRSYQPSNGYESLVRITYRLSKAMEFYFQFRDERKNRNVPLETPVYRTIPGRKQNWILSSSLTMGNLSLRTRVQLSSYRHQATTGGFAMAFDAMYDWSKVSIDTRIAIFDTDDFDNRQYMNERDVPMAFSFPAYYGEGARTYLVGRYHPAKWIDLSLKVARTGYFNSTSSGSGGDTIAGNRRHDVKVQVIFRLN